MTNVQEQLSGWGTPKRQKRVVSVKMIRDWVVFCALTVAFLLISERFIATITGENQFSLGQIGMGAVVGLFLSSIVLILDKEFKADSEEQENALAALIGYDQVDEDTVDYVTEIYDLNSVDCPGSGHIIVEEGFSRRWLIEFELIRVNDRYWVQIINDVGEPALKGRLFASLPELTRSFANDITQPQRS